LKEVLTSLFEELSSKLDYLKGKKIVFSQPNNHEHGDLATNIALTLSKELKQNPRQIAEEIIRNLEIDTNIIEKVEIAGAGFINFKFSNSFFSKIINKIFLQKDNFGKSTKFQEKTAIVEFVSANPTGPLTVGHGRNAVIGDTISTLLEAVGYKVTREYYFNNAGRQMRVLGDSVRLRYLEILGEQVDFPQDYYQGEYIREIAQHIFEEKGYLLKSSEDVAFFKDKAETEIFADIKNTLKNTKIEMQTYFNENSLYENGKIEEILKIFENKNVSYKQDGAIWLKLSELGNQQDKVIIKSTGEPTYRLPDIAYHTSKFERNFDLIVDLFGSDHSATYPDVLAGLKFLGFDTEKVKVLIHQFVTILQNGEVVKMSTRKANFITLDELINEVGSDVVRYFFIMRNISSHLNFDLGIAKKQSDENPVFYLQYAHARISSILRMTETQDLHSSTDNLHLLIKEEEVNLMKKLSQFEEEVLSSAINFEPHKIATYLEELAAFFHKFYTECRIIGTEKSLAEARISLATATKIVIKNGLLLLGIEAPERM